MTTSSAYRHFEVAALLLMPILHGMLLAILWPELSSALLVVLAIASGITLADLFSGVTHWFGDKIGHEHWPWIGAHFIGPFRQHHLDPMDITRHGFVEVNGNNAIVTLTPLVALVLFAPWAPHAALCGQVALLAILVTNQLHAWAHTEAPPRVIWALQRSRLILHPRDHARHHEGEHDRAYCVTNGWCNPLLDRLTGAAS